jgi:hypothetical protein
MKRMLAILVMSFMSAAYATPYVASEYETNENRVTKADSIGAAVIIGKKYDSGLQVSGKVSYSQAELGSGSITNSVEGRVKQSFGAFYLGGRLGERITQTNHFSYYAIDTGVVVPVANAFSIDFSYRYRNAFSNDMNFETNRYGIEAKYKFTKNDAVGLRYSQSYGDSETNSWRLQYTHSF